MKALFLVLPALLASLRTLPAQTIGNVSSRTTGESVVISYELSAAPSQALDVVAFYSLNGGEYQPLKSVSGDVGTGKRLANGKHQLTWDVLKDVASLDGDVKFKVTAVAASGAGGTATRPKWENENFRFEVASCNQSGGMVNITMYLTSLTKDVQFFIGAGYCFLLDEEGDRYDGHRISTSQCPTNCDATNFDLARDIRARYTLIFKPDKVLDEIKLFRLNLNSLDIQFRDGNKIQCR